MNEIKRNMCCHNLASLYKRYADSVLISQSLEVTLDRCHLFSRLYDQHLNHTVRFPAFELFPVPPLQTTMAYDNTPPMSPSQHSFPLYHIQAMVSKPHEEL